MIIIRKAGTPTSETFWIHDELRTGGAAVLYVDGVQYPVTLNATYDYSGVVTITGLSAGAHSYYGTLGAVVTAARTFRTQPVAGAAVKLGFSCDFGGQPWPCYRLMLDTETDMDAYFASEFTYLDADTNYNGAPCSAATISTIPNPNAANTGSADYLAFLECYRRKFNCAMLTGDHVLKKEFMEAFALRISPNNHEFQTVSPGVTSKPGQNRYDAFSVACYEYYYLGQQANADADLDTVPSPKPFYWRETVGDIEVIVPDMISYNDDSLGYLLNGAAQTRGQDKQLAWMKTAIANSTARIIVLFLGTSVPNNTEWTGAGNLFDTIDAKNKTIVAISGNQHRAFARLLNDNLPTRKLVEIGAAPFSAPNNSDIYHYPSETLYFMDATLTAPSDLYVNSVGSAANANWNYATLEWFPNGDHEDSIAHIKIKLKNSVTGGVKWSCIVREGERVPRVNKQRVVAP
jgi:hypothetical protein